MSAPSTATLLTPRADVSPIGHVDARLQPPPVPRPCRDVASLDPAGAVVAAEARA